MSEKQLYVRIGKQIAYKRRGRKLSQEQLLFLTGIDKTFISRIEYGKTNVSIKTLHKISRVLKFKLSDLFKKCV